MESGNEDLFGEEETRSQEEIQKAYLNALADYDTTGRFLIDRLSEGSKEELKVAIKALCVAIAAEENPTLKRGLVHTLAKAANKDETFKSILEDLTKNDIPRIAGTAHGILDGIDALKSETGFFKGSNK